MLVDSHCHLDCIDLSNHNHNLQEVIDAAYRNDVQYLLCVNIELEHFSRIAQIAEQYEHIGISVGVHPNSDATAKLDVDTLVKLAQHQKCIAIGETGLDYYRSHGDVLWQHTRFRHHIQAAIISKNPLIIHTRDAAADTIKIMTEENAHDIGGVMHCFTESWEVAKQALDLGFYISFSGIVTFKNATQLHEVVKKVPLDRMLIETDSPYLAPVPHRGKQNEPAYVKYVAQAVADLRKMSYDEIADATTHNFFRLFTKAIDKAD